MKQDHPMTPNVLTSSQAAPYPTLDPVAYALFSRNGYIRLWSIKGTDMPRLALALNAPLTPLVKQADHEIAVKAAYEAGRRDAATAPDVAGLVGKVRMLIAAGNRLNAEAEECTYEDGVAEVASVDFWSEFRDALEAATAALRNHLNSGEE